MIVFVMYYIYVTSGSSLLIESTDSMILTAAQEIKPLLAATALNDIKLMFTVLLLYYRLSCHSNDQ